MTSDELNAALTELCWTQRRLGVILGRHKNKVNEWCTGKVGVPAYAAHAVKTALALKEQAEYFDALRNRLFPNVK